MSQLILRGTTILGFYTRVHNGNKEIAIDFSSDWTDKFCEDMEVETPGDSYGKSALNLKLNSSNFILTPASRELKDYEIDMVCSTVTGFNYVPRHDKEGKVKSRELHFVVKSSAKDGALHLENYVNAMGDHVGQLKIAYSEKSEEQPSLIEEEPAEKPRGRQRERAAAE